VEKMRQAPCGIPSTVMLNDFLFVLEKKGGLPQRLQRKRKSFNITVDGKRPECHVKTSETKGAYLH